VNRQILTYAEAGDFLGCSGRTVRRLVRLGELPAVKINARVVRLRLVDLSAYVASLAATREQVRGSVIQ